MSADCTVKPSPELIAFLATHEGRCQSCGFHVELMHGHREGCREGVRRRDESLAQVTTAHPDESAVIDAAIVRLCREKAEWSANDLRPLIGGIRGGVVGARVNAAARRGLIRRVGYVPSTDPVVHGHPVALWQSEAA